MSEYRAGVDLYIVHQAPNPLSSSSLSVHVVLAMYVGSSHSEIHTHSIKPPILSPAHLRKRLFLALANILQLTS